MGRYLDRRNFKVRPSGGGRGIELSIPSRLKNNGIYKAGDTAQLYFDDDVIVIVPPNREIDVEKLATALDLVGV